MATTVPFGAALAEKKWPDLADRAQRPTRGLALERAPIRLSRPSSAAGNRNSGRRIGTPELVTPHRHSRACDNDCATICDPRHGEMRARAYAPSNQTQGAMRRVRTGMHDGRDLFPG